MRIVELLQRDGIKPEADLNSGHIFPQALLAGMQAVLVSVEVSRQGIHGALGQASGSLSVFSMSPYIHTAC